MDQNRFGLKRRPFPPTPDADLYYPATLHESALACLTRTVDEDEGFALLTGIPGTGKTQIAHVFLQRLGADVISAFLTNSHFADRSALLQAILYDLGLAHDGGEQTLRIRLTEHLLKTCAEKKRTVVVIDEAHHLNSDLLEELRLLANLEAGSGKAVQFVLVAQPAIMQTLVQPCLESLQQRIAVRSELHPLDVEEAYDYLLHHLRIAGVKPENVFDDTALETIARATHGLPRWLNQAAHQALVLADAGELTTVDAEAALEALSLLGLAPVESAPEGEAESTGEKEPPHPHIQQFMRTA